MKLTPIPFLDYRRIFNIIYSLLISEEAEINHSCLFFSMLGSMILNEHYMTKAKVHAGLAAIKVGEGVDDILIFAEEIDGLVTSSGNGFHCWIIVEDEWIIDFTAPQFPEIIKASGQKCQCSSKMFQKHIDDMSPSPNDFKAIGDFFYSTNYELRDELIDLFVSKQAHLDFIEICNKWYRKPPRKIQKSIPIGNERGDINIIPLRTRSLAGTW